MENRQPLPRRIVSLTASLTETLFALGLEDRVVGVTDTCDYPETVLDKPTRKSGLNSCGSGIRRQSSSAGIRRILCSGSLTAQHRLFRRFKPKGFSGLTAT